MKYKNLQQGFMLRVAIIAFIFIAFSFWAARKFVLPPENFPPQTTFIVEKGESLGGVAYRLYQGKYIKSAEVFKIFMLSFGSEKNISEGAYYFDAPVTSIEVALKISGREFGILQHKVTFPEGFTNTEIANRLKAQFPNFDKELFLSLTKDKQGYLFPDTYSFSPSVSAEEVVQELSQNFQAQISDFEDDFVASGKSQEDIITMASILEKEANANEEAFIVSGILWKRIRMGIPLQVDAPFLFILGKGSSELTAKDLAINSPYNTYKNKGLPPGPINNPGLASIDASLHPVESPYLYYLHDAQGVIHYARTHDEHVANKKKFLSPAKN